MSESERLRLADHLNQYAEWCGEQAIAIARLIERGAMPEEDGQRMISNLHQEADNANEFAAILRSRK